MKIKHMFSAAVVSATLCATGATAAPLTLSEALNVNVDGFRSSVIHDQNGGTTQTSGTTVAKFAPALEGFFNVATGVIEFAGSFIGGGTYEASGNLQLSGSRPLGLFGFLDFTFSGGELGDSMISFNFADETYGPSNEPNGFATVGDDNVISLWGDTGCFDNDDEIARVSVDERVCLGIDLRIVHDGGPDGGVVPLPASAFFLLAGIGGLGVTRKLRKKA